MGLFDGIMIVSDLDFTLLGDNFISEADKRAKIYFEENGGIFTIATGRSFKSAKSVLSNVIIKVPAILNNGPLIQNLNTGEILKVSYLPKETKEFLLSLRDVFPVLGYELFCEDMMYLINSNETSEFHIRHEAMDYKKSEFDEAPDNWVKVVLIDKPDELAKVYDYIKNKDLPFDLVWSYGSIFIELINKTADKGASVLDLANHLGIERKNIISVGDGTNDIGMIKAAGCGLAVSNAIEELKNIAYKTIVSRNENPLDYIVRNINNLIQP